VAGRNSAFVCEVSDPLKGAALAVRIENGIRLIVANYARHEIELAAVVTQDAVIRRLNKETAAPALEQPDLFWSETSAAPLDKGPLRLAPFELVFIDQPSLPDAF
jgi:hypothetical protein